MALTCQKRDCGQRATQAIKLCVPRIGDDIGAPTMGILMGIILCDEHLEEADAAQFIESGGDALKPMIAVMMAGGMPADLDGAFIIGVGVDSAEYGAMVLGQHRPN